MALFRPSYLKEGPGIEKDAPPKTGLALFFEILGREFWQVLKLNLLFVLCVLPLVTFGAARAALAKCTVNMVRDRPNDVWYDFRQQLRQDWQRSTLLGLAELFCVGLLLAGLRLAGGNAVVLTVVLMGAVFCGLFFGYLWPMAVAVDLPAQALFKNALILPLACLHHSLPALAVGALLGGLCFWLFPLSLPLVLFIPFGLSSFVMSFAAWTDIKRLIIRKNDNGGENQ